MPLQPMPFNIYQQKPEFSVENLNGTAQSSENFPEEMEILRNPRTGKFLYPFVKGLYALVCFRALWWKHPYRAESSIPTCFFALVEPL